MCFNALILIAGISCGVPPPPPHWGGYAVSGVMSGDSVTYDCECGFELEGTQTLECGQTGDWGLPACCRSKIIKIYQCYIFIFLHRINDNYCKTIQVNSE